MKSRYTWAHTGHQEHQCQNLSFHRYLEDTQENFTNVLWYSYTGNTGNTSIYTANKRNMSAACRGIFQPWLSPEKGVARRPGFRLKLLSTSTSLFIPFLNRCVCPAPLSVAIMEKGSGKLLFCLLIKCDASIYYLIHVLLIVLRWTKIWLFD